MEFLPPNSASAVQHSFRIYLKIHLWLGNKLNQNNRDGYNKMMIYILLGILYLMFVSQVKVHEKLCSAQCKICVPAAIDCLKMMKLRSQLKSICRTVMVLKMDACGTYFDDCTFEGTEDDSDYMIFFFT